MADTDATGSDDDSWLVAGSADAEEVAAYYDRWAADYDADLRSWSYRAPDVVAGLVMQHAADAESILDAGCGTGLSGRALRDAGFTGELHGVDVSEESLAIARRSGAYTTLAPANLQEPLTFGSDEFDAVVCVGVMTYVPGVEDCWREFGRVVAAGGLVVVTQRSDLWQSRECADIVERLAHDGTWTPIWVSDVRRYLPDSDLWDDRIGVRYVAARVD